MNGILTRSLKFSYLPDFSFEFPDINLPSGQNVWISGMSGSGKTTFLHLLAGLLEPDSGEIIYDNKNIDSLPLVRKDRFRGKNIGMIFQKHFFLDGLSVWENLVAACRLNGNAPETNYLSDLLAQLDIARCKNKRPEQLSQGQQQRFSIARALANKPRWILADEPTSSLDDKNCENFLYLMHMISDGKEISWLVASHDARLKPYFNHSYFLPNIL